MTKSYGFLFLVERSIRGASSLALAGLTVFPVSNRGQDEPINLQTECQQSSGDCSWLPGE
jgi:hypothetical protein